MRNPFSSAADPSAASDPSAPSALDVQRVRHPLKMRRVQVLRREQLSPHMVRVTFGGSDLADFLSASFDDHVKLMLPHPGQSEPDLPEMGPDGRPVPPEGGLRPVMRDYTPRRFDATACELEIEFALHGDGPAAAWAAQATAGQRVGIGGPRGSFVVPTGFDWHLLVGDDTALPAIARRLEELPAGSRTHVVLAVAEADRRALHSAAELQVQWVNPGDSAMVDAVRAMARPTGEGYAWAAGEARTVAQVRDVLVNDWRLDPKRCRCAAYWKAGAAGHHETLG